MSTTTLDDPPLTPTLTIPTTAGLVHVAAGRVDQHQDLARFVRHLDRLPRVVAGSVRVSFLAATTAFDSTTTTTSTTSSTAAVKMVGQVDEGALADARVGLESAVVHGLVGPAHDLVVHAVLDGEQSDGRGVAVA